MMSSRLSALVLAAVFATAGGARAEINLSPKETVRDLEGAKFKQLEFTDGTKTVTYEPPRGWTHAAQNGAQLNLYPPGKVQADAAIRVIPLQRPLTLDEAGRKLLQQQMLDSLPRGAEQVTLVEQETSPLLLNRHETVGATYTFVLSGQKLRMNVLIAPLENSELCFTLSCREADFKDLHAAFRASLFTWQWL